MSRAMLISCSMRCRSRSRSTSRALSRMLAASAANDAVAASVDESAYRRGDVDRKFKGDVGPFGKAYLDSLQRFLQKLGYLRTT